jgi:transposase-like protein
MLGKRRTLPPWQRIELVDLVELGWTRRQAAAWRRVSPATVQTWVARKRSASEADRIDGSWALDRSSRPHRCPRLTSPAEHDRVAAVRARTGWGPRLIAGELGMAHATVSRCLQRRGLSRVAREAREPARRYEWPCPGDLLHMDVKRFQRFTSPGHAKTGDRHRSGAEKRARVGYVSRTPCSTITAATPTPNCTRTSARRRSPASWNGAWRISPSSASRRGGCSPTTRSATSTTAACATC